jgi:hypothetical protein
MKIRVQWYDATGRRAGWEIATLDEIRSRLAGGKAVEIDSRRPGQWIFRLATGEVARCYAR